VVEFGKNSRAERVGVELGGGRVRSVGMGLLLGEFCVLIVILHKGGAGGIIQTCVCPVGFLCDSFPFANRDGQRAAWFGCCPWPQLSRERALAGSGAGPPFPPTVLQNRFSNPSSCHQSDFLTDYAGAEDGPGEGQLRSAAPGAGTTGLAPARAEAPRVFGTLGTSNPCAQCWAVGSAGGGCRAGHGRAEEQGRLSCSRGLTRGLHSGFDPG